MNEPPDLDRLARDLAPRLARLVALLRSDAAVAGTSRPQLAVLGVLLRAGPSRITALAAHEQISQPSMTTLIARMERGGWIERRPDPGDGRAVQVAITDAGRAAYAAGMRHYADSLEQRLHGCAPEHWAALTAVLPALDALISDDTERDEQ